MEPDETDVDDMNTKLEDHAVDSASFGLPFIPWINAEPSGVGRGIIETTKTSMREDLGIFDEI